MKRFLLVLALVAGVAAPAFAEDDPPASTEKPVPITERKHEILTNRTSGFWTSNRPAVGGAYRWRLLAIGTVLAGATAFVLYRLLRRATSDRFNGAGAAAIVPPRRTPVDKSPKGDDAPDVPNALP